MAAVGTLTIEMAANVARLSQDMQKATKTVDGAMSKIQRSVDVAKTAIVGLAGVLTIRQFSSFIKSSAAATEQLERMAFLANTSIADFQRMSLASDRFGISQEKLGDILKDTQDKVGDFMQTGGGAMADFFENIAPKVGVTAEQFRKLNGRDALQLYVSSLEKANLSQSDMVFYMEAIASDSTLLLPLLRENGKAFEEIAIQAEKFGAVMDEQTIAASKDLNANLHSMNNFMDGIGISIYSALLPGLNVLSDSFIRFAESSRIAQHAASAVLIIFQTLAVVGSDVVFVIDQVVKGLVALVEAQYKLLSGNFSGAIKVFEDYNAQARDARDALDEFQAEIMGLGKESDKAEKSVSKLSTSFVSGAKAATDLEKAYEALVKTLRSDITKSTAELQAEQQGLNTAQTDFLKLVSGDDWKQYTIAQRMLVTDLFKQRIETEQLIDAEKARAKAAEQRLKTMLEDEKEFREELAKEDKKNEEDRIKAQEKLYEDHRKEIEKIGDQLTDALMRAFESGKGFGQAFKDTLVNMFRTMVLRPILAPISGAIAGAFGGSGAMAASSGSGMSGGLGLLGVMGVASSAMGTGIAAGFVNALTFNFAGSLAAAGGLIGTGTVAGISAGIGMAAGTLIPVVAAIALIASLFRSGKGPTGSGAFVTTRGVEVNRELVAQTTRSSVSDASVGDFLDRTNQEIKPAVQIIVDTIFERTQSRARSIGLEIALGIDAGLVADLQKNSSYGYASIFIDNERVANFVNRELGKDFEQATIKFTEQLEETIAKAVLDAGNIVIPAGQTATAVLERLGSSILAVNLTFSTLGLSLYETSIAGAEMAATLVDVLGGVENFTMLAAQYYQDFYTEAERTDILTRQLTTSFGQLGLALPETRDAFRQIVEAQDLTTESGRGMFAALMNLSPAFASITPSTDELNAVLSEFGEIVGETESTLGLSTQTLQERYNLETRLLNLQGDTATLRQREIDSLDESNRGLLEQIQALEDSIEVTRQAAEAERDLEDTRRAIESERLSLESRLLGLQGDTAALRERERSSLDESNRALFDRIILLEDEQEAQAELARQQQEAIEVAVRAAEQLANAVREQFAESQRLTDAAFNAVRRSVEAEIDRFQQTFDATDLAFSRLQRSVESAANKSEESITRTYEALNETLNRQLEAASIAKDAAQENVNALQSVFDLLKSNINDLMTEVLPQMTVAQGRAFIAQSLLTAQTTGYLPEQNQLASAISAARSGLSPESFGSAFEMRREQLRLVVQLQRLQNLTGNQLTTAELQLLSTDKQLALTEERISNAKDQFDQDIRQNRAYYDAILHQAQRQVDALRGVDNSVIGVESSVSLLETAIQAERNAQTQISTLQAQLSNAQLQLDALRGIDNSIMNLRTALTNFAGAIQTETQLTPTSGPRSPETLRGNLPSGFFDFSPEQKINYLNQMRITPEELFGVDSNLTQADIDWLRGQNYKVGLPGFAAGGLHSGGMRMVGERGPELEMTGPARYMSNANLASLMGNNSNEEVKQLREENKVQMRALVSLQNRMTKVVEQWNNDGLPNERVEA